MIRKNLPKLIVFFLSSILISDAFSYTKDKFDINENIIDYCNINKDNQNEKNECIEEYVMQVASNVMYDSVFNFCYEYKSIDSNLHTNEITRNCQQYEAYYLTELNGSKEFDINKIRLDIKTGSLSYIESLFLMHKIKNQIPDYLKPSVKRKDILSTCDIEFKTQINHETLPLIKDYLFEKIPCLIDYEENIIFNITNHNVYEVCEKKIEVNDIKFENLLNRINTVCENYSFKEYNNYKAYIDYIQTIPIHLILNI